MITRSEAGAEIVKKAEKEGVIEAKKLTEEQLKELKSLASFKKRENLKNIYDKTEPIRILNMQVEPEMLVGFLDDE